MAGFYDPDYARDRRIAELTRAVRAIEARLAALEQHTTSTLSGDEQTQARSEAEPHQNPPHRENGG